MQFKKLVMCILTTSILLITVCAVFAQSTDTDIRSEIDTIQQRLRLVESDISEIKTLLLRLLSQQLPQQQQQRQPTQPTSVKGREFNIGDNLVLGKETSKIIMVEFSDYQCPYCGRYARETLPEIRKQYVDGGSIRYVVIDQPLAMHPEAAKAAEAAHCAKEQDKFWQMHDAMMARQDGLKDLPSYARELKLNIREFENCLKTGKYKDAVNTVQIRYEYECTDK